MLFDVNVKLRNVTIVFFNFIAGVSVYIYTNMTESFSDCDSESVKSVQQIPGDGIVPIRMEFNVSGINFHLPDTLSGDLPALLKCVDKNAANLPELFGSYRSPFDIKEIVLNHSMLVIYTHYHEQKSRGNGNKFSIGD